MNDLYIYWQVVLRATIENWKFMDMMTAGLISVVDQNFIMIHPRLFETLPIYMGDNHFTNDEVWWYVFCNGVYGKIFMVFTWWQHKILIWVINDIHMIIIENMNLNYK